MASVNHPLFSIIIPTRNRAELFAVALGSVLEQRFSNFEVIVVNDGSSDDQAARYREIIARSTERIRLFSLEQTERGHGQSFALNFGVSQAIGQYVGFLDDDDQWIDPEHLGRVAQIIGANRQVDVILANQKAFSKGSPVNRTVWIEDLSSRLAAPRDTVGAYSVRPADLLLCQAHCHLNTTIVSRDLYTDIGGLDEALWYECDRDFYLRVIDKAISIKFLPDIVSRHNIPDPAARASMSTSESEISKRRYQLTLLNKACRDSVRPEIREYAQQHRVYVLSYLAIQSARHGKPGPALYYGLGSLFARLALVRLNRHSPDLRAEGTDSPAAA